MLKKLRSMSDNELSAISYKAGFHTPSSRIDTLAYHLHVIRDDISKDVDASLKYDSPHEFKQLLIHMSKFNTFGLRDLMTFYRKRDRIKNLEYQDGLKYDADKPYSGLLADFAPALHEVAKVATFGAKKYGVRNWKNVDNAEFRYHNAAWRHRLAADNDIESCDDESGELHIAHEIWNLLAQLTLHLEEKK